MHVSVVCSKESTIKVPTVTNTQSLAYLHTGAVARSRYANHVLNHIGLLEGLKLMVPRDRTRDSRAVQVRCAPK